MVKKVLVNSDNQVVNVIEIEDDAVWEIPNGLRLMDFSIGAEPGGTLSGVTFIPKPIPAPTRRETLYGLMVDNSASIDEIREYLAGA